MWRVRIPGYLGSYVRNVLSFSLFCQVVKNWSQRLSSGVFTCAVSQIEVGSQEHLFSVVIIYPSWHLPRLSAFLPDLRWLISGSLLASFWSQSQVVFRLASLLSVACWPSCSWRTTVAHGTSVKLSQALWARRDTVRLCLFYHTRLSGQRSRAWQASEALGWDNE